MENSSVIVEHGSCLYIYIIYINVIAKVMISHVNSQVDVIMLPLPMTDLVI